MENQLISTDNNITTKLELNNKTDEFVSVTLDQRSKINATSYKIFEDSIKTIGEKIIDVLQVIINPNLKVNNSTVSQETNKPLVNDLAIAVKETVEDVNLKKANSILTGNSKLLLKIGDMLFSIRDIGIIYTSDGENWTNVEGEIGSKSIKTTFKLSNYLIALCTDNSFYYSLNGINWTRITDSNNYLSPSVTIDDLYILKNPDCVCIKVGTNYYNFTTENLNITVSSYITGKQIYKSLNDTLFYHDERYYIGSHVEFETYIPPINVDPGPISGPIYSGPIIDSGPSYGGEIGSGGIGSGGIGIGGDLYIP